MNRCAVLLIATCAAPAVVGAQSLAPAGAARFAAIDALVDATPARATQSVTALAAYLAQAGADDLARSRAIYRWVTQNVDYDVAGFQAGSYGDLSPDGVLQRRSAVCEGYARLAEALGTAMGLEVMVVSGWSKGYGYTSGQRFEGRTNHAWNAVRIDGQWRLMDPTWGAGYLDEQMRFVRRFQEHYFLTAPAAFIFDHLPEEPRWQLLERPVSAAEYADLAYLRPMFFVAGFRVGSHPRARIAVEERLLVTLGVTQPVELSAQVVHAATNRPLERDLALIHVTDSAAAVQAVFPAPGDYLLRLFARPRGTDMPLQWILDYRVQVARGARDAAFPMVYSGFGANRATLHEPLTGVLDAGRTYRFRLRVPGAIDVAVVAGEQWTHFARNGEDFTADVTATPGQLVVYAKYDAASNYTGLLRYVGR